MSNALNVFEAPLNGISLVEASAGTGKTYSITSLYIRIILEKGLLPSQILVLTYTEAATAELKFRLRNRLKESISAFKGGLEKDDEFLKNLLKQNYEEAENKLKKALDTFDEAAVFTIHGFCNRLLNEHSLQFDVAPGFEVIKDESELLQDIADDYWRNFIRSAGNSYEDRVLLEFLIDEKFGPDELKSVLMEILNRPYVKMEPSGLNLDQLKSQIKNLKTKFEEVKYYWSEEKGDMESILFHENLNKRKYQLNQREGLLDDLTECLESEFPQIKPFDGLSKFGLEISQNGTKGHDFPDLNISKAIDEYLEICEELSLLKPAFIIDSVNEIQAELLRKKETRNVLSYNDFLMKVNEGLQNDSTGNLADSLSKQYPMALVDEFQDTDPVQYSIFRQIYYGRENTALFMIGDPKQAIYGFRGADIYTYLDAKTDAHASQDFTLNFNYRSTDKMIGAVNEIFQQSSSPFLIDGLEFHKAQFPPAKTENEYVASKSGKAISSLECIKLTQKEKANKPEIEKQIYEAVANEIADLLSGNYTIRGRLIQEKDIAVLVRNGYQGDHLQRELRERGLKSVLKSKTSVFETPEAGELLLVLKSLQKLSYEPRLRAALATQLLGNKAGEIQAMLNDEKSWTKVYSQFLELKTIWEKKGIEAVIEQIFEQFQVKTKLASKPDFERRITNLMHLSELLSKAEREERLHGKSLLKWFYRKKMDDSTNSDEEELRLESDGELIQISTIHAAKGLQFPIVFCPFLWDSPKSKDRNDIYRFYKDEKLHVDINIGVKNEQRDRNKFLDLKEEMAEATRLAYVALTRSISACYLFLPDYKTMGLSPLASIMDGKDHADKRARKEVLKESNDEPFSFDSMIKRLSECKNICVREPKTDIELVKKMKFQPAKMKFKAAEFGRKDLFHFPRMLSYSSLAFGKEQGETAHDYDAVYDQKPAMPAVYNRFTFPKGANAGTFLHKVFEDVIFSNPKNLKEVVSTNLESHGFSEKWSPIVQMWTDEVLKHNLGELGISLNSLKEESLLKEMEFHFPVGNLNADDLWKLVRNDEDLETQNKDRISGFMKGFIDLTFRVNGRYYILDYKSNHLGDSSENYTPEALQTEIFHSAYDLQYHIYATALHRFLKQKMSDYDYDQHFGGVLYVFLRGVNLQNPGSGVFFDKPPKKLIEKLDSYFKTEKDI
ncbi:MAG: exodeoxyribonuclease V subunit beta [Balneolaceae bacterium]